MNFWDLRVVVPTRDHPTRLGGCLDALRQSRH
jgi:hypothetical protein